MLSFLKKLFLILLNSFVLFACIRDVIIKEGPENREMVLNCILDTKKDTVFVQLNYSKTIQSTELFEPVKNAQIQLLEENMRIGGLIWKDSSTYILPFSVLPGKTYRIEAKTGNNVVWAETTVPKSIDAKIDNSKIGFYTNSFQILLNDNINEANFYWISATGFEGTQENRRKNIACELYSNFEYADDFNKRISQNSMYKFEYEYYIRFTESELPVGLTEIIFYPQCIDNPVEVFLLSVDYHLDKYMKSSLLLHKMDLYAEDMPIIYAPFPMYSNINGGTGIFGSYNSVSEKFIGK